MHRYAVHRPACGLRGHTRCFSTTFKFLSPLRPLANEQILAIETSCDDTSVAVLQVQQESSHESTQQSKVLFHKTITANTEQYRGIHPEIALKSHVANTAILVQEACQQRRQEKGSPWRPTLVAATRGPGMRSNLSVGLHTGKGLAVAWNVPFIGVHHMQAHALTPRLVSTLSVEDGLCPPNGLSSTTKPDFPYLSLLVSGGHTLLLKSYSQTRHTILAETYDTALGGFIDKSARAILPAELCKSPYGRSLEKFGFPNGQADYEYLAPSNRGEELKVRRTPYHWSLKPPFSVSAGDKSSRRMAYSFAGITTQVEQVMYPERHLSTTQVERKASDIDLNERRYLAREAMRQGFEHVMSRVLLHLSDTPEDGRCPVVVSGGVAANQYLRHVMRKMLDARGFTDLGSL